MKHYIIPKPGISFNPLAKRDASLRFPAKQMPIRHLCARVREAGDLGRGTESSQKEPEEAKLPKESIERSE